MIATAPPPPVPAPHVSRYEAAEELLRRRRARKGLLDFTTYTMPAYEVSWHHRLMVSYLDRWVHGDVTHLIICTAPQHGKSELVSRRLPAYLLGRDPSARVIACSYGSDLASEMNTDVQRIMDEQLYRMLFPETRLASANKDNTDRNKGKFGVVGHRGSYKGAGVGGPITGKPMDWGIIDDPFKNREEADSATVREGVWRWFTGAFLSRAHNGTRLLVNHTRWHPDDLVGRLLKQQEENPGAIKWTVLVLPAIAEEVRCAGDPRKPGEPLWPQRHSLASLMARKAASLTDWHSLYQQRPRAEGAFEWPDEMFEWDGFWFDEWPDNLTLKVMSLDPSKGRESKAADYQALTLWGRTPDGTEWVEADLGKRPMVAARSPDGTAMSGGMVEYALERYQAFGPECLALETNTFQQLLTIPFRLVAKLMRLEMFRVVEMENTVNKNVRIRRLGEPLSQRRIRFRRTPGTRLLVEQLRQFPNADHDDGPDSLEQCRRCAIEVHNGRQQKGRR